tara:strand:- start:1637 stop:2056 length:420 start_codon:yes stop_codon:yes gene_type:complete
MAKENKGWLEETLINWGLVSNYSRIISEEELDCPAHQKVIAVDFFNCKHKQDILDIGDSLREIKEENGIDKPMSEDYEHLFHLLYSYVKNESISLKSRVLALEQLASVSLITEAAKTVLGDQAFIKHSKAALHERIQKG